MFLLKFLDVCGIKFKKSKSTISQCEIDNVLFTFAEVEHDFAALAHIENGVFGQSLNFNLVSFFYDKDSQIIIFLCNFCK